MCYKKVNNATIKFAVFSQQTSFQNLCVNIAHIRSKSFHCVRKYTKFVSFFSGSYQMIFTPFKNAKIIKTALKLITSYVKI